MEINTSKIEAEIERIGWTRYKLAKVLGAKPQWVYAVLKDGKNRTFKTVERIAKVLGLDPKDLIK